MVNVGMTYENMLDLFEALVIKYFRDRACIKQDTIIDEKSSGSIITYVIAVTAKTSIFMASYQI